MNELSSNDTLSVKLDYITRDIREIKADVKEMKSDYVSRRELDAEVKSVNERISSENRAIQEQISIPIKMIYVTAGVVLLAVLYTVLRLIGLK